MKFTVLFILLILSIISHGQDLDSLKRTLKPRKFIDRIEIFAGPNLSFNHGNKFIENYKDENVTNTRLLKWGWAAGVGVNHPITNRIGLNVRLQYETKGTKNELDVPDINGLGRIIINSEYTYQYFTLSAVPQISLGKKSRFRIGIGVYYSRIKEIQGYDQQLYDREDMEDTEIRFEGRIFRDLRDDGIVQGGAISRGLFRMEKYDYGSMLMVDYSVFIRKQAFSFQLLNYYGLKNINRNNPYSIEEKNYTLLFTIAYPLQL